MKNILIFSVLSMFLMTGCLWVFDKTGIQGSGTVTIEQRAVSSFDKIEIISGVFTVYLSQGDVESVEVEIDDNLQLYIEVRNEGSKLVIEIIDRIKLGKTTKNNIYITLKDIDLLSVTGVCNIKTSGSLYLPAFTFDVNGVCNGELELFCDQLNAHLDGVSKIELRGKVKNLYVNNSGVGNFNGRKLEAVKANVINSGVGSVSVYATEELSMTNSGVGSITYSGDAEVKTMNSSGVGKIKKE